LAVIFYVLLFSFPPLINSLFFLFQHLIGNRKNFFFLEKNGRQKQKSKDNRIETKSIQEKKRQKGKGGKRKREKWPRVQPKEKKKKKKKIFFKER